MVPVDFRAGKGCVKEESNANLLGNLLSEQRRKKHQVVIVHPDDIAVLRNLSHGVGKSHISSLIRGPGGFIKVNFAWMVVEERPQNAEKRGKSN